MGWISVVVGLQYLGSLVRTSNRQGFIGGRFFYCGLGVSSRKAISVGISFQLVSGGFCRIEEGFLFLASLLGFDI